MKCTISNFLFLLMVTIGLVSADDSAAIAYSQSPSSRLSSEQLAQFPNFPSRPELDDDDFDDIRDEIEDRRDDDRWRSDRSRRGRSQPGWRR